MTALADHMDSRRYLDAIPASRVASEAALRPRGGKRRAAESRVRLHRAGQGHPGRRAKRNDPSAVLLNAADAADAVARQSEFWDSTQVLAHAEIARMALQEALADLDEELRGLGRVLLTARKRRRRREIQDSADLLRSAARALDEAHALNLVRGD